MISRALRRVARSSIMVSLMCLEKLSTPTVLLVSTEVSLFPALVLSSTEGSTSVSTIQSSLSSLLPSRTTSESTSWLDGVSPSSPVSPLTPLIPSEEEWWWPLVKPSSIPDPSTAHNRSLLRKVSSPSSRVLVLTSLEVSPVLVPSQVTTTSSLRSTPMLSPPPSDQKYSLPTYFLLSFYQNSEWLSSMFFVLC